MSHIISTWSPLDVVLPTITDDTEYAMYYVTDAGAIDGLNISFSVGDWLVYLKKDGVGNWYKTNGIVTFNTSSSTNNPDPGFYTRVRLDNNGNIITADYIEADDLPAHTHNLSDISDQDNLIDLIKSTIGDMLVGSESSNSVNLVYDKNTKTISANVNIDGISIIKNRYGQIEVGSDIVSSNSTSVSGTVSIENVEDLTNRLEVLETLINKNQILINSDSGLSEKNTDGGKLLKVNVDGASIIVNAYGQLEVNPEYYVDENGNLAVGGNCANHQHTYDQIQGLEDYIIQVFNEHNTVSASEIPIDGETIIINKSGQLAAVSTSVAAHTHIMDDIEDLNKAKADTWASDQPLKGDISTDYSQGIIDLTSFNIGYSIEQLSEKLKEINDTVEYTKSMIGKVVPTEPGDISYADISYTYESERKVINIKTLEKEIAGLNATVQIGLVYPCNAGSITAYIDGKEYETIKFSGQTAVNDTASMVDPKGEVSGTLKVIEIKDSYYNIVSFQGFYNSATLSYTLPSAIDAGKHTISFTQVVGNKAYHSKSAIVNIYKEVKPTIEVTELANLSPNKYISGIWKYQGDGNYKAEIVVKNISKGIYSPVNVLYSDLDGIIKSYNPDRYLDDDNSAVYSIIYNVEEKYRDKNLVFKTFKFDESLYDTYTYHIPYIIFDTTTVDEDTYRYIPIKYDEPESIETLGGFNNYNSSDRIGSYELVIHNDIAQFDSINYAEHGIGQNYTSLLNDGAYRWINFIFKSDYRNNIYFDLIKGDKTLFNKNIDGTLNNIKIYIGQSKDLVPEVWVDGNSPYIGNGSAYGIGWAGLDLFRSTQERRYVTFGQLPAINGGYIFIKIGITEDSTLNCKTLVDSILESLNE